VIDAYLELNIEPFMELGFMPEAMASGDQTVFWWRGNITPPRSWEDWAGCAELDLFLERHEVTLVEISAVERDETPPWWDDERLYG